jgi:uncharacterized protein YjiS (DUF1127 family)
METAMNANIPVLPIAGSAVLRALFAALALLTHWFKSLARARRHRREAAALAGLDRRMLADIGINRADLNDAFSEPFWHDPTALLNERVSERRQYRTTLRAPQERVETGFRRPATNRMPRYTV